MCIKWALQKNKKCCQLTAKTYLYVGLSLLSLGTLMSFLSLICPYWRTGYGRDEGLYYYCSGGDCHHLGEIDSGEEGWWRFVQVMMPLCVLSCLLSQTAAVYYTVQRWQGHKVEHRIPLAALFLAIVPGVLIVLLGIAYRQGVYRKIDGISQGWCLHFTSAIPTLLIIGGIWVRQAWACENKVDSCSKDTPGKAVLPPPPPPYGA